MQRQRSILCGQSFTPVADFRPQQASAVRMHKCNCCTHNASTVPEGLPSAVPIVRCASSRQLCSLLGRLCDSLEQQALTRPRKQVQLLLPRGRARDFVEETLLDFIQLNLFAPRVAAGDGHRFRRKDGTVLRPVGGGRRRDASCVRGKSGPNSFCLPVRGRRPTAAAVSAPTHLVLTF